MPLECAKVRTFVTPIAVSRLAALVVACAVPCSLSGEVVHMKNGDVIYADRVTQSANTVQYEIGDNSYTVPKSRVEHIEAGVPAPARRSDLTNYTPAVPAVGEKELLDQLVQHGSVNREALNQIESRGNT